ncbi:MAG: class I SAM-dependent DNA methyltransferase [Saprospiraceae bacterium]
MPLSWNEIKSRAVTFTNEWKNEEQEHAEAKSFWDDFFKVFGISRRRIVTFEKSVKKLNNKQGFIDLFWSGTLLVEHKSKGKNLDKAYDQALGYFHGLKEHELPRYVLVSDFENFRLFDLDKDTKHEFTIHEFINNIHLFGFIAGYEQRTYKDEDPVNIKAAELMGKLHDKLKAVGYTGHDLEVYLVRLLFCLFAEDTGIFEKSRFQEYIELHTKEDGSDLAMHLAQIFQVLDTPKEKRLDNLDESLSQFPYVNGLLFTENLRFASFDSAMRENLLKACRLDWGGISPAIFGSMFQAAMDSQERRNLGAHFTSEKNIQKLIRPLFLDELYAEFEKIKDNSKKLNIFHHKLATLKFFDPACGSGNFLIITYRELRDLEIQVLQALHKTGQGFLNVGDIILVNVNQFYGIEIDEFASQIAQVGMWLIDHQMNLKVSEIFGQYFVRLPLKQSATIVYSDALEIDWNDVVPNNSLSYIIGNPPFIGSNIMKKEQRKQIVNIFNKKSGGGTLDYVVGWYILAAKYIQNTKIKAAFVSTNSIVQGEQTSLLWGLLQNEYKTKIHFAHRTFKWNNEAKGNAAVYCVIIGFANFDNSNKIIFDYEDIKGEAQAIKAKNINAYLVDSKNILINKSTKPICNVPTIMKGNYYAKSKGLIVEEKDLPFLLENEPNSKKWIKKLIGASEFINNKKRYCLWLIDCPPNELRKMPLVMDRINQVREDRLKSTDKAMQNLAPTRFREMNNPSSCLIIPVVSSENRKYIPMGFIGKDTISTNSNLIMPNAEIFHFGILISIMHMSWVKYTCGRLKSDFRYSKNIVYNNYPFPKEPSDKNRKKVEKAAQKVLDVQAEFPESSLADLYDPLAMPLKLVKAHQALDKAVDLCYRPQAFTNERNRIEFLFDLYEQYTAPLMVVDKKKGKRKK